MMECFRRPTVADVMAAKARGLRPLRCSTRLCTRVNAVRSGCIDRPPIMVNSCAGRMGHAAAEAVVKAGLELVPFTFTGESMGVAVRNIGVSGIPVYIVDYKTRQKAMDEILEKYPNLIMIDYTLPAAVNDNAQFYLKNQVPFVMGTSGGDREKLLEDVAAGNLHAVIAPQMGKQIVAFQAMMAFMGDSFPGVFSSYRLQVVESHQRTKVDTSGTAKAIVRSFQDMGVGFELSDIERIRSPSDQLHRMKVPEAALDGHAFHTYRLTSPDGSVAFEFQHNVCGRAVYAEGTVDAALFLAQKIAEGGQKRLFNMIDVLRAGSMR